MLAVLRLFVDLSMGWRLDLMVNELTARERRCSDWLQFTGCEACGSREGELAAGLAATQPAPARPTVADPAAPAAPAVPAAPQELPEGPYLASLRCAHLGNNHLSQFPSALLKAPLVRRQLAVGLPCAARA